MEKHILSRKNVIAMMLRYMKENLDYMKVIRHFTNDGACINSYDGLTICYYLATVMGTKSVFMPREDINAITVNFYKKILRPILFTELVSHVLFNKDLGYHKDLFAKIKKRNIEEMKTTYINHNSCSIYFSDIILEEQHNFYVSSNFKTQLRFMERDFFKTLF